MFLNMIIVDLLVFFVRLEVECFFEEVVVFFRYDCVGFDVVEVL